MGNAWSPCDQIKHMKVNFWRWTNKVSSLSMLSPASVKKKTIIIMKKVKKIKNKMMKKEIKWK